jgi:hypothetical protein
MTDIGLAARRAAIIAALAWAFGAACTNGGMPAASGGAGMGGTGGGNAAGMGGSTAWTCQQIRTCVFDTCSTDACVQTCAAKGDADAQAKFEALRACTAQACTPVTDVNCACGEQCLDGGGCFAEVDACLDGAPADLICDSALCH